MVNVQLITAIVGLLSATASAAALPATEKRASCVYTCGKTCYWQADIDAALKQGVSLHNSGQAKNSYPHQYNDFEGFDFPTAAPWYEFPILNTFKVYNGGSPGADRVIFDSQGNFDSLITHTGASGNNFVACQEN